MNRTWIALLAALAATSAPALDETLPQGWRAEDGTLVHEQSGARCPLEVEGGFTRKTLTSAGAPDLGVCTYVGPNEREGLIRVRQYVAGRGETPMAVQNDKTLMEPQFGSRRPASTLRMGPGPNRNGASTRQLVVTMARNGILIDCIGRHLANDEDKTATDFAIKCMTVQPEPK